MLKQQVSKVHQDNIIFFTDRRSLFERVAYIAHVGPMIAKEASVKNLRYA